MGLRWRRITATLPAVVGWMTEGNEIHALCVRGLPKGTACIGTIVEDLMRVSLVVEHSSFDEIHAPGLLTKDDLPEHPAPTFRTMDQQAQATDARYEQQMKALCEDLGIGTSESLTAEQLRIFVRHLVEQYRMELQTERRKLLPLQDRIAELEAAHR